jgi:hypothetical protein
MTPPARKPRIALMGEFSAGKSTLSNLLLGARPLPEKVTATRLSPVWMSQGVQEPYRVNVDGTEEPVSLTELETIPVEETRVIRLFFEADILGLCDLIDFPGISDPNMSSEVWQRMVPEVDAVLWCTHATQAWRQSEAAAWESIPEHIRARSALLITRFDKLTTERDKLRVVNRVKKETAGLFEAIFPISLTEALAAGDDYEAFQSSGGVALLEHLIPMIEDLAAQDLVTPVFEPAAPAATPAEEALAPTPAFASSRVEAFHPPEPEPELEAKLDPDSDVEPQADQAHLDEPPGPQASLDVGSADDLADEGSGVTGPAVIPRRVRPAGAKLRPGRPARPAASGLVVDMSDDTPRPVSRVVAAKELRSIFHGSDDNEVA